MVRLILIFTFLSNVLVIHAQSSIKGKVENLEKKPIPYTNVVLYSSVDSSYVSGSITDEKGAFIFENLDAQEYKIEISFLGYTTITELIQLNKTGVPFIFTLLENVSELEEVIVEGKRKLIVKKTDRIVVDIENSIRSEYGNAIDVLSVTPGLKVQNNQLQMLGKPEIIVLINNRPSNLSGENLMVFLETLSSQDIKSIEIMTTPPAEYEANGNGGIVNIILKKEISNSWKANIGASFRKRTEYKATNNVALTYNYNKLFFTNSFYLQEGIYHQSQENTSLFDQDDWFTESSFDRGFLEYNNRLSLGYQLSPKYSITFQYLYSRSDQSTKERPYTIVSEALNGMEIGRLDTDGEEEQEIKFICYKRLGIKIQK